MEENEIELESVDPIPPFDSSIEIGPDANEKTGNINEEKSEKLVRFPITRIKHLVKMDPDVNLCSLDALFLITKATVIFPNFISTIDFRMTC